MMNLDLATLAAIKDAQRIDPPPPIKWHEQRINDRGVMVQAIIAPLGDVLVPRSLSDLDPEKLAALVAELLAAGAPSWIKQARARLWDGNKIALVMYYDRAALG